MNKNDFIRLMEGPGPDNRDLMGELSSLVDVFPYFHSAHMLLLKGLQNTSDVKFENQLRSSALHIANREVLYYYLTRDDVAMKGDGIVMEGDDDAMKGDETADIPFSGTNGNNDVADMQQVVIELAKNSEDFISELEKDDITHDTGSSPKGYSVIITPESGDKENDASLIVVNEESGEIEERIVYMDPGFWLPEKEEELLELDNGYDKIAESPGQDVPPPGEMESEGPLSVQQQQSALIDRFIIANPRIEPVREQDDISFPDISKSSAGERDGLVSETLAGIYVKQGYYSRAIDIYEKLSLKYPGKSTYFASLIQEIQELIKK
ncbi:MAG: hypothetical protein GX158_08260 [Bacteroidales bacterium]|jgi:hypothetical protein|nr:hypothetical protein [Bacteroidales bacterium]